MQLWDRRARYQSLLYIVHWRGVAGLCLRPRSEYVINFNQLLHSSKGRLIEWFLYTGFWYSSSFGNPTSAAIGLGYTQELVRPSSSKLETVSRWPCSRVDLITLIFTACPALGTASATEPQFYQHHSLQRSPYISSRSIHLRRRNSRHVSQITSLDARHGCLHPTKLSLLWSPGWFLQ